MHMRVSQTNTTTPPARMQILQCTTKDTTLYCGLFRDSVPRFYDDLYVLRLVSFLYIAVLWRKGVFVVGTRPCGGFPLFFLFLCGRGVFLYYAISPRLASSMNKIKKIKKRGQRSTQQCTSPILLVKQTK